MDKDTIGALLFAAGLCGIVLASNPAIASVFTADIVLGDSTLSAYPPPSGTPYYAYFSVSLDDNTHASALVAFETNTGAGPSFPYWMTDAGAAAFNVNATSWSVSGISGDCGGCTYSDSGAITDGSFGSFNDSISSNLSTPTNNLTAVVSFTLTDLSGTWATADSVLTNVAVHLGVCSSGDTECQGTPTEFIATGFAGFGTPVTTTPLPAALPLFATALGALGLFGWRRNRKSQPVAA